jgi:superfamily II DNA or RNA helicase
MSADLRWFFERYPALVSDADLAALEDGKRLFEEDRASSEAILLPDWQPPSRHGFRPGKEAYHSQKQASELWLRRKGLLLGDDVGLGKTIVALDALAGSQYLPAAIVVQAHLPSQWVKEYITPFTYMQAHIIEGTKPYTLPPANLYIFKYTNIAGWSDVIATGMFKAVVFDEIQELRRGDKAEKGKAAKVFYNSTALRLGLSATPVYNLGSEIWNILDVIDPDVLGPWDEFTREWCTYAGSDKWKVNDPDALGSYLRECGVFLRRLRQGRPINRIPIEVDFDEEIAEDAAELAKQLAIKVLKGSFTEAGQASRELDAFARLQTGLAKAKSVAVLARMYLEKGIPLILAGWHRQVYDIWLEELRDFNPVMYTGSETPKQKDRTKQAFISGDTNLLLISLRSGAGLDGLQKRCSTVMIGEMDFSPAVVEQLLGRVDRPGQQADEITAIFPYVNYGSDPVLMSINAVKKDQQRGINDPGTVMQPIHTDESRIKILAKSFLEKQE